MAFVVQPAVRPVSRPHSRPVSSTGSPSRVGSTVFAQPRPYGAVYLAPSTAVGAQQTFIAEPLVQPPAAARPPRHGSLALSQASAAPRTTIVVPVTTVAAAAPGPSAAGGGAVVAPPTAAPAELRIGSRTRGIPDPASVEQQKRAHSRSLAQQLEEGNRSLRRQNEERKTQLRQAAQQRKQELILQVEQQLKLDEMVLDLQTNEALMSLKKAALGQQAALDQQAAALVLDYQQRKMEEEFVATQAEMQRQYKENRVQLEKQQQQQAERARRPSDDTGGQSTPATSDGQEAPSVDEDVGNDAGPATFSLPTLASLPPAVPPVALPAPAPLLVPAAAATSVAALPSGASQPTITSYGVPLTGALQAALRSSSPAVRSSSPAVVRSAPLAPAGAVPVTVLGALPLTARGRVRPAVSGPALVVGGGGPRSPSASIPTASSFGFAAQRTRQG